MLNGYRRGVDQTPRQSRRRLTAAIALVLLAGLVWVDAARPHKPTDEYGASHGQTRPFAAQDTAARARGQSLLPGDRGMRAVIVASPNDCIGNLHFANVLRRRSVAAVVGSPELIVQGSPSDTVGLRRILPQGVAGSPMRLLGSHERALLHAMGHHETPILLLFDDQDRLRFGTQVESDPVTRVAVARAIVHLTTRDPTR